MNKIIVGLVAALFLLPATIVVAQEPATIDPVVKVAIQKYADQYKVSSTEMYHVLKCESGFNSIQSRVPSIKGPNGREDSWGVAQIHLPAHPTVALEEAMDPEFAIEWTAQQFALGKQTMWTCYRTLYM